MYTLIIYNSKSAGVYLPVESKISTFMWKIDSFFVSIVDHQEIARMVFLHHKTNAAVMGIRQDIPT